MEALEYSLTGRLLLPLISLLYAWYDGSALARLLRALGSLGARLRSGSALWAFAAREGALSRAWPRSLTCGLLSVVINLPGALLHWIYRRLKPVLDDSLAARLGFGMGEQAPILVGWLFVLFVLIPYEHWDNRYSLFGFVLALLLTLAGGMRRRSLRLDVSAVGPYLACFACAVFLAFPLSAFPALSLRFLFFHITCMLCVLVVVSTVEREEQLVRLVSFAALGLLGMSAAGVVQGVLGVEVNASYVDLSVNEGMPGRVYAMFENPNAFAQVLVLLIPLAVGLCLGSRRWGGRVLGFFAATLGIAAILLTYGRASWIGLAVAAFVFVLLWNRALLPWAVLAALAAVPLLPDSVFNRILTIFNTKDTSTTSRFPLYQAALRLLTLRPVSGGGLGTDAVRRAVKDLNLYHGVAPFVHAHNVYLQVWAETGLLGIASFFGSMLWSVKRAARAALLPDCPASVRLIAAGGAASLTGILVCGLADYMWNYPRVMMIFWFTVAVTLSAVRLARRHSAHAGRNA